MPIWCAVSVLGGVSCFDGTMRPMSHVVAPFVFHPEKRTTKKSQGKMPWLEWGYLSQQGPNPS